MRKGQAWVWINVEIVSDKRLCRLAFEDRWHYIALLCCQMQGILDSEDDLSMVRRNVADKLGIPVTRLRDVVKRLSKYGLIDEATMVPSINVRWRNPA